jgi:hypothetical protein
MTAQESSANATGVHLLFGQIEFSPLRSRWCERSSEADGRGKRLDFAVGSHRRRIRGSSLDKLGTP